jgi:hypothetical protein
MMQLKPPMVQMDLLQPQAYQIASAEEDWFPPSFYGKFKTLQKKVTMEEKRDEKTKDRNNQQTRDDGRIRTGGMGGAAGGQATGTGGRYRSGGAAGGGMGDSMYGGGGAGGMRSRDRGGRGGQGQQDGMYGQGGDPSTRKRGAQKGRTRGADESGLYGDMMYGPGGMDMMGKPSTDEAYRDFADVLINYRTKLGELEKPLLFWAFDDTAQPGFTYEYRIRLGVFNPVAGTNQLAEQDAKKKNQVILWSEFSGVTKPVEVRNRMYFFAKDVQEAKKSATVEVARYSLGYWRSEDFEVRPGETIGRETKPKVEEKKRPPGPAGARITDPMYGYMQGGPGGPPRPGGLGALGPGGAYGSGGPGSSDNITRPELIDYRTGKVLVDLVQVGDWGEAPNLKPRMYNDMLYTGDGKSIEHMPVSTSNWSKDLLAAYQYVRTEVRKEQQPFRQFKKGGIRSRVQPMMGGYEGMEGYQQDMIGMPGMGGPGGSPYR